MAGAKRTPATRNLQFGGVPNPERHLRSVGAFLPQVVIPNPSRCFASGRREESAFASVERKGVASMQKRRALRAEHKKACEAIQSLIKKAAKAGASGPLPEDVDLYWDLTTIQETLEWVHSDMIKTVTKRGDPNHYSELMGHQFLALGPVDATLLGPRH